MEKEETKEAIRCCIRMLIILESNLGYKLTSYTIDDETLNMTEEEWEEIDDNNN